MAAGRGIEPRPVDRAAAAVAGADAVRLGRIRGERSEPPGSRRLASGRQAGHDGQVGPLVSYASPEFSHVRMGPSPYYRTKIGIVS